MGSERVILPSCELALEAMDLTPHLPQRFLVQRRGLLGVNGQEVLGEGLLDLTLNQRVQAVGQNMGKVTRNVGASDDLLDLDGQVLAQKVSRC